MDRLSVIQQCCSQHLKTLDISSYDPLCRDRDGERSIIGKTKVAALPFEAEFFFNRWWLSGDGSKSGAGDVWWEVDGDLVMFTASRCVMLEPLHQSGSVWAQWSLCVCHTRGCKIEGMHLWTFGKAHCIFHFGFCQRNRYTTTLSWDLEGQH